MIRAADEFDDPTWRLGDPTPEQISQQTARIRKGWGKREHSKRRGEVPREPLTVPEYPASVLGIDWQASVETFY